MTGQLGSTGLQAMPWEGRHSWHSGAHLPLLSSPGLAIISDDYGPGGAAGGWTSPSRCCRRRHPHDSDSHDSAVGRMEQLADVVRSDSAASGLNDYSTFQKRDFGGYSVDTFRSRQPFQVQGNDVIGSFAQRQD